MAKDRKVALLRGSQPRPVLPRRLQQPPGSARPGDQFGGWRTVAPSGDRQNPSQRPASERAGADHVGIAGALGNWKPSRAVETASAPAMVGNLYQEGLVTPARAAADGVSGRSGADFRLRFTGGVVVPFLWCRWSRVGAQLRIGVRE